MGIISQISLRDITADAEILSLLVELTYACPLRCKHCYLGDLKNLKTWLPTDRLLIYLNEARERGLFNLTLTGGEPLLYPDLEQLMKWAYKNDVMVRLYTSLFSLKDEHVRLLSTSPVYEVETSIYSSEPEKHDVFTGVKGSFEKLVRGIVRLREVGIKVNFKFIAHRGNFTEVDAVMRLAEKLGVNIYATTVITPCRDGCYQEVQILDEEQLKEIFFAHPEIFGGAEERNPNGPLCNVSSSLYIDAAGNIKKCMEHPDVLGNVHTHMPEEVFNSNRYRKAGGIADDLPEECKGCEMSRWCRLCPALVLKNERETSNMFCTMAKVRKDFIERSDNSQMNGGK